MIIKIRNWYDIILDGGDGQADRNLGSIAPYINVNTTISSNKKILSIIYYDSINKSIRRALGRNPNMEFENITGGYNDAGPIVTIPELNGLIGNSFTIDFTMYTYFYFDNTNLYCFTNTPDILQIIFTIIPLLDLNGTGNNILRKCITENYSLYLFSNGTSIYYLNYIIDGNFKPVEIVNDYNGTYYDCYTDDSTGTYYLNYTTTTSTQIISFTNSITGLVGTITYSLGNNSENAANFDNKTDPPSTPSNYILVPNVTNVPITISIWFNTISLDEQTPFSLTSNNLAGNGLFIEIFNGSISLEMAIASSSINIVSSNWPNSDTIIEVDTWYHCCITINSNFLATLYLNNSVIGTGQGTTSIENINKFVLGGLIETRGFGGSLQNFNVYNRVLTTQEITNLYNFNDISIGRVINLPLDGQIINPNYNVIGTLSDVINSYVMSKVFYFNNNVSIYLKKTADTNAYEGKIDISKNIYITKKFKNLIDFKPIVYNNNISLISIDGSSNLVNCSVYTGNTFNLNNKIPVISFDATSINDETYIYYLGTDYLLHQVWNPIMFYKIKINNYVTSLTGTVASASSSIVPSFNLNITDYVLNTNSITDSITFNITINSSNYTGIGYSGQNIQINDLSNNNYYVKLTPPNLISGFNTSILDENYIPGYYLVADTSGNNSPYYSILDCYGCPVWYSINTSKPNQGNTNPRPYSLFLGKGNNRVIKNIFDGDLAREYIDINTLQQQSYRISKDGSGGKPSWNASDALELLAPPERAGNIFIMSHYLGFYLQEIKPTNNINNVTLLNDELYLANIDYTNLIKLNGIGTCNKVSIFGNYGWQGNMAINTISNITYNKISGNAPDVINIHLTDFNNHFLCTLNSGSQIQITSIIYIGDLYYSLPSMFQVDTVKLNQIVWEWWSTNYFNTEDNDFFHLNSIDIHPVTGNIVLSCKNCSSIICIEYSTKKILWVIDSDGQLSTEFKDSSNVKFLIPTAEPNIGGSNYYGTGSQHDARWQIDIDPLTSGNDIISIYDNETGSRKPRSRGVIYEIDLTNNIALFRSNVYHNSTTSDSMGSYKIIKEDNNSYSHVLNWVQMHPCLQEFAGDSNGMGTQTLLYQMDLSGDHYRIVKAKPSQMSIEAMRRTSGLPFSTPTL